MVCDNTFCVNPDHLFLGTAKTNALDCASKNRTFCKKNETPHQFLSYKNENHGRAKLTVNQVKETKQKLKNK